MWPALPWIALLVGGCDPATEPVAPAPTEDLRVHMQQHLADVRTLRDAVAMGHVGAARTAVSAFLDHPVARDLPGDWLPRVAAMGEAAIGVRDAATPGGMATHAAGLAKACGDCHSAVMAPVTLPRPAAADDHPAGSHALLDGLWAGLIEPSSERFAAAAAGLAIAVPPGGDPTVLDSARRAIADGASHESIAGAVLAACAACHAPALHPADPPLRGQVGSQPAR